MKIERWASGLVLFILLSGSAYSSNVRILFMNVTTKDTRGPILKLIDEYQRLNKGVNATPIFVESGSLYDALAEKPDVFVTQPGKLCENAGIGIFADLRKTIAPGTIKDLLPSYLNAFTFNKAIYGIPFRGFTNILQYNKDLFNNAGLTAPAFDWTWEKQFYSACIKLTKDTNGDGKPDQYGTVSIPSNSFTSVLYSYGGRLTDSTFKKVMYTDTNSMTAVKFVIKLHQEGLVERQSEAYDRNALGTHPFFTGRAGMVIGSSGRPDGVPGIQATAKAKGIDINIGSAPIPRGPKGAVASVWSHCAGIFANTKNKQPAAAFVNFLCSRQAQPLIYKSLEGLPGTSSGYSELLNRKLLDPKWIDYCRRGVIETVRSSAGYLDTQLWGDAEGIISGEKTFNDLLGNAKTEAMDIIRQYELSI